MSRLQHYYLLSLHLQRECSRKAYKWNSRFNAFITASKHRCESIFPKASALFIRAETDKSSVKKSAAFWISKHGFHSAQSSQRQLYARAKYQYHGIVPSAYRIHSEETDKHRYEQRKGKNQKNLRGKERQENAATRRKQKFQKGYNSADDIKKKIISLHTMDLELATMIKDYEEKLGTPSFYPNSLIDIKDNIQNFGSFSQYQSVQKEQKKEWVRKFTDIGQSSLIQTEEDYINICKILRQMIIKWCRIKVESPVVAQWLSSGEYQSGSRVTMSSLPPMNAFNYAVLLESLRKQRAELIDSLSQHERKKNSYLSTGLLQWFRRTANFFTDSSPTNNNQPEKSLNHLKDLAAHISPRFTTNSAHYNLIMKSFLELNFIRDSNIRSKDEAIEAILSLTKRSSERGNPNCSPDRLMYITAMKYYQDEPTLENSKKAFHLLMTMIENRKQNMEKAFLPNRHSYNLVLVSFRNAVSRMIHLKDKLEALAHVEIIIDEIEQDDTILKDKLINGLETPLVDESGESDSQNFLDGYSLPYHIALRLIFEIGQENLEDYFERIDKIMIRMIGEEAHNDLYTDPKADLPNNIDSKLLFELLYYLSTGDRERIDKAKVLLHKMEHARNQSLTNESFWDTHYPDYRSYNTVIWGLIRQSEKLYNKKRRNIDILKRQIIKKDAMYATGLLDSMIKNKSSLPTPVTFIRLLRLWSLSKSKDAGERAEEILSRMNIHACISSKFTGKADLHMRLYSTALDCWLASVNAECPGAVKRAAILVKRMKSQYGHLSMDTDKDDSEYITLNRNVGYIYISLLKCCAENTLEQDKADALEVAFDTYNAILDENISPSPLMFKLLILCCRFAPTPQKQRSLSQQVFDSACKHGLVSKDLLKALKQINFNLYQTYQKHPDHSINIKIT